MFNFDDKWEWYDTYKYSFFGVTFVVFFLVSLTKSVEKLKGVAIVGIMFIVYLVGCFVYLTPEYYDYYSRRDSFTFHWFIFDPFALKTFGICLYIFLNQYTILPICNSVRDPSFSRSSKIVYRCLYSLLFMYIIIIVCGYLSEPDNTQEEIFLLRKPITSDNMVLVGKIGFGITLIIAIMVKSKYLLLYLHELIDNFGKHDEKSVQNGEKATENEKKTEENMADPTRPKELTVPEEKHEHELSDEEEDEPPHPENSQKKVVINFFFLMFIAVLAVLLMYKLTFILSVAGSLVGFFETIFFPVWLVVEINRKKAFLKAPLLWLIVLVGALVSLGCFGSIFYNLA